MRPLMFALAASLFAACSQIHTLRIDAEDHWVDDSAVSPRVAERGYRRIAVMPPSKTDDDEKTLSLAPLESELLRHGLEVYTSALSPTALAEASVEETSVTEKVDVLSEVERALLRARQTNSEALLQVERMEWSYHQVARQFIFDGGALVSASPDQYSWHNGFGRSLSFPAILFTGRLLDVESGEVVIAFSMRDTLISGLEESYTETYEFPGWFGSDEVTLRSRSTALNEEWLVAAHGRVIRRLCARIAASIAGEADGAAPASASG